MPPLTSFLGTRRNRQSPMDQFTSSFRQAIPRAAQLTSDINSAGPQSFGQFIEPLLKQGLTRGIQDDATLPQHQQAQQALGQNLNTALSRANVGSARRGSFDPSAGATRQASSIYGNALAGLEASRAAQRAQQVSQTTGQLAGLAGIPARQSEAAQRGFGSIAGQLAGLNRRRSSGIRF